MRKTDEITNTMDTIDSRDIIARVEELEELRDERIEELKRFIEDPDEGGGRSYLEEYKDELAGLEEYEESKFEMDEMKELRLLRALVEDAEQSPDWKYGETLINEAYFEKHAKDFAEDIGATDKNYRWPCNHIVWGAAAEELKNDYFEVDFDGVTFLIRS